MANDTHFDYTGPDAPRPVPENRWGTPERRALEGAAWNKTHPDFRGLYGGARHVLRATHLGTYPVALATMTDAELRALACI